ELGVHRRDGLDLARLVVDDHQGAVRRGQEGVSQRVPHRFACHRRLTFFRKSSHSESERPRLASRKPIVRMAPESTRLPGVVLLASEEATESGTPVPVGRAPTPAEQCRVESGEENAVEPPDLTADQRHRRHRARPGDDQNVTANRGPPRHGRTTAARPMTRVSMVTLAPTASPADLTRRSPPRPPGSRYG